MHDSRGQFLQVLRFIETCAPHLPPSPQRASSALSHHQLTPGQVGGPHNCAFLGSGCSGVACVAGGEYGFSIGPGASRRGRREAKGHSETGLGSTVLSTGLKLVGEAEDERCSTGQRDCWGWQQWPHASGPVCAVSIDRTAPASLAGSGGPRWRRPVRKLAEVEPRSLQPGRAPQGQSPSPGWMAVSFGGASGGREQRPGREVDAMSVTGPAGGQSGGSSRAALGAGAGQPLRPGGSSSRCA